ncbi:hypothetical protein ACFSZS_24560 [Seohaeicola zhoushanensis]
MAAVNLLRPDVLACTPSYALHLAEWAEARGMDLRNSTVQRIMVAGEPGAANRPCGSASRPLGAPR